MRMKKILWNVGGALLFLANIFAMMLCLADNGGLWSLVLIALAVADWFYICKRPTWLEV